MPLPVSMSRADWNNIRTVQGEITRWAEETFPHRSKDHEVLYKLVLQEIPEMLEHKRTHGTVGIGGELADCFILLLDLASIWDVDVATAIRDKMMVNYAREWDIDPDSGVAQHRPTTAPTTCTPEAAAKRSPYCPFCRSHLHTRPIKEEDRYRAPTIGSFSNYWCEDCKQDFDDTIPF